MLLRSLPCANRERGFAIAPILYLLGLIGVGAGVLFSGYSQILRSNQTMSNTLAAKNDLQGSATTLSATSWMSSLKGYLCPPLTGSTPNPPSAGTALVDGCTGIAGVSTVGIPIAGQATLPANAASISSAGSPLETGIFNAGAGVKVLDPWGHNYLYCRWENSIGSANAFMIISGGPSGKIQTNCGSTVPGGDNLMVLLSTAVAQNRAAVWQTVSSGSSVTGAQFGATGSQVYIGTAGNVTIPGTLGVTGTTSLGTTSIAGALTATDISDTPIAGSTGSFTTLAVGGAGQMTVDVSGNINTSAMLGVSGLSTLGQVSAGSSTLSYATVTNNASVGGTLGVTGATTLGSTSVSDLSVTDVSNEAWFGGGLNTSTGKVQIGTSVAAVGSSAPLLTAGKGIGSPPVYPFTVDQYGSVTGGTFSGAFNGNLTGSQSGGSVSATSLSASGATILSGTLNGTSAVFSGAVQAGSFVGNMTMGGGGVTFTGVLPIANGGTNSATASGALTNLFIGAGTLAGLIPGADLVSGSVTSTQMSSTGITAGTPYSTVIMDSAGRVVSGTVGAAITSQITDTGGEAIGVGTSTGALFTIGGTVEGNWTSTGLMVGSSKVAVNPLDVYGGQAIGAGYAGVDTAPTNGLIVQGNVGIGTTNPLSYALDVNGTINATNFVGNGSGLTGVGTSSITGIIPVPNGGTGDSTLTSNGILYGNGTNPLQVTAQGGANTILTANSGAPAWSGTPTINTSVTVPTVIGGTGAGSALTLESTSGTGTSDYIAFLTGSQSEAMRITTSGKVGIGTAAPQSLLETYGGEVQVGSSGLGCTPANAGALRFSGTTAYVCDGTNWDVFGGAGGGGLPALTNDYFWVGNGSNAATAVQMSQDVTFTNTGVTTVGKIQNVSVGSPTGTAGSAVVLAGSPTLTGTVTGASSNWSGTVGIGTASPNTNALLDVFSTTKGILPPRLSSANEVSMGTSLPTGLVVYNTTNNELESWNGTAWEAVGANAADAGGSNTQLQYNNNGDLGGTAGLTWDSTNDALTLATIANPVASAFTITGGALTGATSYPALNITQTWNASGTTFTGIKENITNTASHTGSLLEDLQVGGVSQFHVDKSGDGYFAGNVGVGTTNAQSLVEAYGGEVQVGSSGASCAANIAGALRYNGGSAYVCDGTNWDVIGGSAGGTLPALTNGDVWIGNGSNVATAVAVTGDVTITNLGVDTVAKIQGTTVSGTTGTTNVVFSASPTVTGTVTGASSTWSGTVGVGTAAPQSMVEVYGGEVQVGSSGNSCSSARAGALRFSGTTAYVCDGTNWDVFGGAGGGTLPALTNDYLWIGNGSNAATAVQMSQDCTITNAGVITCLKTNNVAFGTLATLNAAPAGTLTGTTLASNIVTSSLTTVGTIGSGTWQGTVISPTYGGTGASNPTANAIYKANGSSAMTASALSDNGTIVSSTESVDVTSNAVVTEVANAGTTGTTINLLAKLTGAPSTAVKTATSDSGGAVGIVIGGAGTSGNAQIAIAGQASCVFDNATVAGDYIGISSTTAGDCHDAGSTYPTAGQVLGRVLSTNSSSATPRGVALFTPEIQGAVNSSLASGDIWVGNGSNVATAVALSGDCTISNSGAITCLKTNGVAFGSLATLNAAPAGTLTGTTLASNVVSSSLTSVGTITIGVWNGTAIGIAYGGTNSSSQTTNGVNYFNGTNITSGTSLVFSGGNLGIGTATMAQALTVNGNIDIYGANNGYLTEIPNATTTGTTVNKLAKLTTGGKALIAATTDTDGEIGVVVGQAGTSGNAQIAIGGQAGCIFDSTPSAVGDFVTISSTTAGDCHDSGLTSRTTIQSQTIGQVLSTTAISGSIYPVAVAMNGSGGGVPAGTTGQVQYNSGSSSFAANSNFTFLTATNELVVGTGAATPSASTGTVAGFVMNVIPQAVSLTTTGSVGSGITINTGGSGQMAYYSAGSTLSGTSDLVVSGSNIGIGSSSPATTLDVGGTARLAGTSSAFATQLTNAAVPVTVSATAATGTINYYINSQSVLYYTSNASANWTVNFAFSSGTTMNTALSTGQQVTAVFEVTQGSTPYYNSSIQVDGTTSGVTTYWLGGTAPSAGNASGVDVYQYNIVKTGSATYTIFASLTQY